MFAVIFEVTPTSEGKEEYLKIASELRDFLKDRQGFISMERFASLVEDKNFSVSHSGRMRPPLKNGGPSWNTGQPRPGVKTYSLNPIESGWPKWSEITPIQRGAKPRQIQMPHSVNDCFDPAVPIR